MVIRSYAVDVNPIENVKNDERRWKYNSTTCIDPVGYLLGRHTGGLLITAAQRCAFRPPEEPAEARLYGTLPDRFF